MSTLEKRLEDHQYKAWVKCGLCLAYVKAGLEEFADERSKRAHNIVITNVEKTNSYDSVCPNAVDVKLKRGYWQLDCCNKCDEYVNEIEKLKSRGFSFNRFNWKNSNIQLWPTDAWEMMKVFMNQGQKLHQNNAQDSDLSAVLNFLDHCSIPRVDITDQINIAKVRDARTATMHSTSMKMPIADFKSYTDSMIDLLEDGCVLYRDKEAQNAVQKIKEIQGADFCITKSSEFALLTKKTEQVQRETQLLYEEVDGLKTEYEDIKSLLDKKEHNLTELLQHETEQREQNLNQLENQIQEKQDKIKELSSELFSIKDLIRQDKDLYRKMDIRLRSTEIALDKTSTEVKEVTHNHNLLRKEVDDIKQFLGIRQSADSQQKAVLQTETEKQLVNQLSNQLTTNPRFDEPHRLQNLQRANDDLKKCIDDLKAYHAQRNETKLIKDLQSKNFKLKQENDSLYQELNKVISDRSATDTRRELTKNREKIKQLEQEVEFLKGNIALEKYKMTETELQNFKERNEILERNNIYLVDENERLTTEINNFQQYIDHNNKMSLTCILDEQEDLKTEVKYYRERAMDLEMQYKTLKQDKSETDFILQYVTNANENFETSVEQLSLKYEEAEKQFKYMSAINSDLENDITISKRKLHESQSELEKTKTQLMTEKNMCRSLHSEQQTLNHILDQINDERQVKFKENLKKQKALKHQIHILEFENRDLNENISKLNLELEQQTKEAMENQTQDQQLIKYDQTRTSSSDYSEDGRNHENSFATETQITDNLKGPGLVGAVMENSNAILDMKVVSSSTVGVKLKDDRREPIITGCVFLSTGQLVLCDFNNIKIKLFSSDLAVEDSLHLQERQPWDISAVNSSTVIITLPGEHELQYIELAPMLQPGRVIKLDKVCQGVCVAGDSIYVTCYSQGGNDGEVIIFDSDGTVKSRLGAVIENPSSYMFDSPNYLSVSTTTGRIYVSDYGRETLTCLSVDGSIIYQYKDPAFKCPQGLYVDASDGVIVCSFDSNDLQVVSSNGEKTITLLSVKDGIRCPESVAYRPTDCTLIVGCFNSEKLQVFKLSH